MSLLNNSKLRVALLQVHIEPGYPQKNKEHIAAWLDKAVAMTPKPDLIVLPEMWNTGYALDLLDDIADLEGRETRQFLSSFARKHGIRIIGGSVAEQVNGKVLNSMYVFNREGEVDAKYSKMHLFRLMEEHEHLVAGSELVTFELDHQFTAGASICYDIRFPEMARSLALRGAKALIVPAQWPHPRLHHWRTLLLARAIENQMYVISCNSVGISGDSTFFGHSLIIDPWGEIVAEGGEEEEIIIGEIDLSLVDDVRSRIPVFEDRRYELYFK